MNKTMCVKDIDTLQQQHKEKNLKSKNEKTKQNNNTIVILQQCHSSDRMAGM